MVCEYDTCIFDSLIKQDESLFDFLFPLCLIKGSMVGSPWVELRNKDGLVVSRHHFVCMQTITKKEVDIINDYHIVHYLSSVFRMGSKYDIELKACVVKLVASIQYREKIEQAMVSIVSAIDILCKKNKIIESTLFDLLDDETKSALRLIIDESSDKMKSLAIILKKSNKYEYANYIEVVRNKLLSIDSRPGNFGAKVVRLLELYNFNDKYVINKTFPEPGVCNWEKELSRCRGVAVHGMIDDENDIKKIFIILCHLQDIVLRILLKSFCYDGLYGPLCRFGNASEPIDWVLPKTSPLLLGYENSIDE